MRSLLIFLSLLFGVIPPTAAVTLKCTDSSGQPVSDLDVDLRAGQIKWGIVRFRVNQQSDRYITAYEVVPASRVGGETWVLDRVSGEYIRAGVAILATQFSGPTPLDPVLKSYTYTGVCKAAVL
jgi:hypothetical protein